MIFRVAPQGIGMTLRLTGPESHIFCMTFRILTGPGFCMRFILQSPGWVWRKFRVRCASIRWVICGPGRVICGRDAPNCILQNNRSYAGPPISQMSRIYVLGQKTTSRFSVFRLYLHHEKMS